MKKLIIGLFLVLLLVGCDEAVVPPNPNAPSNPDPIEDPVVESKLTYEYLFEETHYHALTIKISKNDADDLNQKMHEHNKKFGSFKTDYQIVADLVYETDSFTETVYNVGFRTRGNTSRTSLFDSEGTLNRNHFKIDFNDPIGIDEASKDFQKIKDRTVFGVTELNLKYNRNYDTSYVTERFSYNLFNDMGVLAPKMVPVLLTLQIDNTKTIMGVYHIFESIDRSFLNRNLNNDDGDLYKVLWQQFGPAALEDNYDSRAIGIKDESINYFPSYDLKTNKKTSTHQQLKSFIKNINELEGEAFKTYIEANFEVDSFINLLATGVMLGNPDDYRAMGNNYYLYYQTDKKKWLMIPYDYDHGLGQGWDGAPVFTNHTVGADIYTWGNLNTHQWGQEVKHPLSDKILSFDDYQEKYENALNLLISTYFTYDRYLALHLEEKNIFNQHSTKGLIQVPFEERGYSYFEDKRNDVIAQLEFYKENPSSRP